MTQQVDLNAQVHGYYYGTQAAIEALTGVPLGSLGYATDRSANQHFGTYGAAGWEWDTGGSTNPPITGSFVFYDENILRGSALELNVRGNTSVLIVTGTRADLFISGSTQYDIFNGTSLSSGELAAGDFFGILDESDNFLVAKIAYSQIRESLRLFFNNRYQPSGSVAQIQDNGVPKGTAYTFNFSDGLFASISGTVADISGINAPQDYISGLGIDYVTSGTISVRPGEAYVPGLGRNVVVTGSISQVLPTPTPTGTWQNVYLWENSGVPSIQVTGTAPSNPYRGRARTKLNDSNYRYLGSLLVNSQGYLYRFSTTVVGGSLEMHWVENQSLAPFQITTLSGSTANQTVLMQGLLPVGMAGISDQILVIPTVTAPATTSWQLGFGDEIPDNSVLTAENVIRIDNQTSSVVNSFFPPVPTKIPGVSLLFRSSSATIIIGVRVRGIRIPRS